ncbi:MAG: hypothetical protein ACYDCK_01865, partial [Thermoplasmatota archaeon]
GEGVWALSVTNQAQCSSSGGGCGGDGIGALSVTGDASCTRYCGSPYDDGGLGAVSVVGHAYCSTPFNAKSTNPEQVLFVRCIGGRDVAHQLGLPV